MDKNTMRYVLDPSHFKGVVVTSMRDGVHNDYGDGETIEELRKREKNPNLMVVTGERVDFMVRRHAKSLQLPFKEITEDRYHDYLECVPPKRFQGNRFFVGECHTHNLYTFCFELNGKFYSGLRAINIPGADLERQIRDFGKRNSFRAKLTVDDPSSDDDPKTQFTTYSFEGTEGNPLFIRGLMPKTDNVDENQADRNEMALALRSLRKHNYQYMTLHGDHECVFDFFEWLSDNNYTLEIHDSLLQFSRRDFVDFHGNVAEYSNSFRYRIYDREILHLVIHLLRTVKREYRWRR